MPAHAEARTAEKTSHTRMPACFMIVPRSCGECGSPRRGNMHKTMFTSCTNAMRIHGAPYATLSSHGPDLEKIVRNATGKPYQCQNPVGRALEARIIVSCRAPWMVVAARGELSGPSQPFERALRGERGPACRSWIGDDRRQRRVVPMRTGSRMHSLHIPLSRLVLVLVLCASPEGLARAAAEEEPPITRPGARPSLRVGALPPDLVLDGRLTETAWTTAPDSIADLTMTEPEEGGVPTRPTVVKVLADRHAVVFGVLCRDAEPRKIVAFSKARDSDLSEEDH